MKTIIPIGLGDIESTIYERFEMVAAHLKTKPAIHCNQIETTFEELKERSQTFAARVCESVPLGSPVAILLSQGPEFLSATLGCLASGNPYAPLDPAYPIERLKLMCEVSKSSLLFTNKENLGLARAISQAGTKILLVEELSAQQTRVFRATPNSLAYMLFTSGSTGKPKAVVDCHRNLLHNSVRQTSAFKLSSADNQILLYTCGVYGGARDIIASLVNGMTLYHYPVEKEGNAGIGAWIKQHHISIYCSVASVFRHLVKDITHKDDLESVRIIKLGGEASRRSDIEIFKQLFPRSCVFYTGLASTETGTTCQLPITFETSIESEILPLGVAAPGMTVHLYSENGEPVSDGEVGEITVESPYLSLGYYGLPEQTSEKFFERNGKRFFKTGDLGRFDSSGCLWHCGRGDSQVKVRGNRIDLGEVESAFLKQAEVQDSLIAVRQDDQKENYLVAYLVVKKDQIFDEVAFRNRISQLVPPFMVPTFIVRLPEFQRTVNGKIDRSVLPDPMKIGRASTTAQAFDSWENEIGSIWKSVLKLPDLKRDQNFFSVGGHSLKLVQLLNEVQKKTGAKVILKDFLKKPVFSELLRLVGECKLPKPRIILQMKVARSHKVVVYFPDSFGFGYESKSLAESLPTDVGLIAVNYFDCDFSDAAPEKVVAALMDSLVPAIAGKRITVCAEGSGAKLIPMFIQAVKGKCELVGIDIVNPRIDTLTSQLCASLETSVSVEGTIAHRARSASQFSAKLSSLKLSEKLPAVPSKVFLGDKALINQHLLLTEAAPGVFVEPQVIVFDQTNGFASDRKKLASFLATSSIEYLVRTIDARVA